MLYVNERPHKDRGSGVCVQCHNETFIIGCSEEERLNQLHKCRGEYMRHEGMFLPNCLLCCNRIVT